jgi:FlaA1/EpsC-like NDP-sugar epimerase
VAAKKAIAIITSTNEKATQIVNRIPVENYRLLLISKYPNRFSELAKALRTNHPGAEWEIIECLKDGCWEADMIIVDIDVNETREVAELIKEVATQKLVISFSADENEAENEDLQNLLTYSRVVKVVNKINRKDVSIYGKDNEALCEVSKILKNSKLEKSFNREDQIKYIKIKN